MCRFWVGDLSARFVDKREAKSKATAVLNFDISILTLKLELFQKYSHLYYICRQTLISENLGFFFNKLRTWACIDTWYKLKLNRILGDMLDFNYFIWFNRSFVICIFVNVIFCILIFFPFLSIQKIYIRVYIIFNIIIVQIVALV